MGNDYIKREDVIKVIRDYGKGAISDGMTALDPVADIVALARAVEWLPAARCDERCRRCVYSQLNGGGYDCTLGSE